MPRQEKRQRHTQPTCAVGQLLDAHRIRLGLGSMEVIREMNKRGKLTYTRTSWPKWMTGTIPRQDARRLLADLLEIPHDTFAEVVARQEQERDGFSAPESTREPESSVPYADADHMVARVTHGDRDVVTFTVDKRLILEAVGDAVVMPTIAVQHEPTTIRPMNFPNPSLEEPADHEFIELVHGTIQQLVMLDNHFGGDDIAGMAVRLFRSVTDRLASGRYHPSIERDLMAVAGEVGELAGWLLFDADRQHFATQTNRDALYWAEMAGDKSMVNFILSNVGLQAIHLARPIEALHVAQRVRDTEGQMSPRVRALIHVREGRALAIAGKKLDALRDFERARAFFSDGVRGTDPQWAWWIDDFEITGHEGLCHREAGDLIGAVDLFNRAIESCPPGRARDRLMYHAHLLRTLADLRDWSQAIGVIERSVPYAHEVGSSRVATFFRDGIAHIRLTESVPESVRDGAEHIANLLNDHGSYR